MADPPRRGGGITASSTIDRSRLRPLPDFDLGGGDLPAILITADRTPRVRDEARARDVPIVNKPVKPAALRALLAQWRIQHATAAE